MTHWVARVKDGIVLEAAVPLPDGSNVNDYFPVDTATGVWLNSPDGLPQSNWTYDYDTHEYAAPVIAGPTLRQQASAALESGLTIHSTVHSEINGLYGIDDKSQSRITAVSVYVLHNDQFPGPSDTFSWVLLDGDVAEFPSTVVFMNAATAIADYVAELIMIVLTDTGSLPSSTVTID